MLGQMLANRRIEKNQCNIKNAKTELKSAIGINSGIEIWDWNQMLRAHNNLHLKGHTRSNMSVQRRNGQQTWILHMAIPKVLQRARTYRPGVPGRRCCNWNQGANYSTYDQELLACMFVLSVKPWA